MKAVAAKYEGTPCRKCKGTLRYASNTVCVVCALSRSRNMPANTRKLHKEGCKAYYLENKEALLGKRVNYYSSNKELVKQRVHKYRQENPEFVAAGRKAYYDANRETCQDRTRQWGKENPTRVSYYSSMRRARMEQATPSWLSVEDKATIAGFYEMAKRISDCLGTKHHVDHVYPLKGKTSSGLHVPWNLQVIPAAANLSKSNKLPKGLYND